MSRTSTTPGLNVLVEQLAPPPIPAVQALLRSYDGRAGEAVDLSQAVPGYPPHPDMLRWLGEAAGKRDYCGYGDIQGEAVLREALAADLSSVYLADVGAENVQITAGGNQAFFVTLLSLVRPGEEVLLVRPYYFNHEMTLRMMGLKVRIVDADPLNGFLPSLAEIDAAIGPETRALFVVTPNNPTGAVYDAALLDGLYDCCERHGMFLVVDETYRDFLPPDAECPHRLFRKARWGDHFIHLYSFSKVFCIPGHRLGAVVCGPAVIGQLQKIMDNLQICAPRPAQHAVAFALPRLQMWKHENRIRIDERRAAFGEIIRLSPGWSIASIGAYFAYLKHPFPQLTAMEMTARLAGTCGILTLPGTCFGDNQQPYLRAAFANADVHAIGRLADRFPSREHAEAH